MDDLASLAAICRHLGLPLSHFYLSLLFALVLLMGTKEEREEKNPLIIFFHNHNHNTVSQLIDAASSFFLPVVFPRTCEQRSDG
jgi:hypothetical protein